MVPGVIPVRRASSCWVTSWLSRYSIKARPRSIAGTSEEWYCSASESSHLSCGVTSSLTVHSTATSPASLAAVSLRSPAKSKYPFAVDRTTGSRFERTEREFSRRPLAFFVRGRSGSGKIWSIGIFNLLTSYILGVRRDSNSHTCGIGMSSTN